MESIYVENELSIIGEDYSLIFILKSIASMTAIAIRRKAGLNVLMYLLMSYWRWLRVAHAIST